MPTTYTNPATVQHPFLFLYLEIASSAVFLSSITFHRNHILYGIFEMLGLNKIECFDNNVSNENIIV
jgi:hypothetical protein